MRRYNKGWKFDSSRHSLAAQGVKTGKKLCHHTLKAVDKLYAKASTYKGKKKKLSSIDAVIVVGKQIANPISIATPEEFVEVIGVGQGKKKK